MESLHVGCPHCGAKNRIPRARLGEQPVCGRCGHELLADKPIALDEARFDALVAATDLPVVVDFWAPWCGPCRAMAPQFDAAAQSLRGRALLIKVNSDDSPGLSARFGIRSIPTLLRLEHGREVARSSGAMPAAQIVQFAS